MKRKTPQITTTESPPFWGGEIIDSTNQFYLEISKNVLTEKEYEILEKLLLEKYSIRMLSKNYNVGDEKIKQIYKKVYTKVKYLSGLLKEMEKQKKNKKIDDAFLNKKISESSFPFSIRLHNVLNRNGCKTFGDLIAIHIHDYPKFKGFKIKCITEFIRFIEFENIQEKFDGLCEFKNKYLSEKDR